MEYIAKYNRLHDKKRMKAKLEKHFDNVDITGRGKNINIELGERTLYISNDTMYNELYTNALYYLCLHLQRAADKIHNYKYGGYAVFSIMLYNDKYIAMNKTFKNWASAMKYPYDMKGLKFEQSFKLGMNLDLSNTDFKEPNNNNKLTISDVIQYNSDLREFRHQAIRDVLRRITKATGAKVEDIFYCIHLNKLVDEEIIGVVPKYRKDLDHNIINKYVNSEFIKKNKLPLNKDIVQKLETLRQLLIEQYDKINKYNVYDSNEYKDAVHNLGYYSIWRECKITIDIDKLNKLIQELGQNEYINVDLTPEEQEHYMKELYKQSYYKHLAYNDKIYRGKLEGLDDDNIPIELLDKDMLLNLERDELRNILHYRRYKGQALEYYHIYEDKLNKYIERVKEKAKQKKTGKPKGNKKTTPYTNRAINKGLYAMQQLDNIEYNNGVELFNSIDRPDTAAEEWLLENDPTAYIQSYAPVITDDEQLHQLLDKQ